MSYEGYEEYLCKKGHYTAIDCYEDDPTVCPHCKAPMVWRHAVDQTNGEIRGCAGTRPARLKQVGEEVWMQEMSRPLYAIPKNGRIQPRTPSEKP